MTALVVVVGILATGGAIARARQLGRARRVVVRTQRVGLPRLSAAPPRWFVEAVGSTPLSQRVGEAWRAYVVGLVIGCAGGLLVAGPVVALLVASAVVTTPMLVNVVVRARRDAAYDASLAVALDAVARAVRGGGSLHAAIGEASAGLHGGAGDDLRRIAATTQRGVRLDAALADWRRDRDRSSVHLAVGAIALAAQTGGPPARVIEDVAASLRMRLQTEAEARSLGAQARLSAIVVGVAPVGFALIACSLDSRNATLMFGTPIGIACLVAGLGFDIAGAVWMHRISQAVLR